MTRAIGIPFLGVLLAGHALAQSHQVVPNQLTVPLNGTGTFQIVIGQGVSPSCNTTGTITMSPVGVVNIVPGTINFQGGTSGAFTVFGNRIGVTVVTLNWIFSCPPAPGSPAFSVNITRQLGINVPSAGSSAPKTAASNSNSGAVSDPVSTATGELTGFDAFADLSMGGPLPLEFRRYYASFLRANNIMSALGTNWMHNFEVKLALQTDSATVTLFRGKSIRFNRAGTAWQLAGKERYDYQLVSAGSELRFLNPLEDRMYTFNSAGALTGIGDRNGNQLAVTQSAGGQGPERVSDGLGRALTFTYGGARLSSVADQAGRRVTFEYTGELPTAAVDANGKRAAYGYTAAGAVTGLMTAETRPAGNKPYTQEFDSQGRVTRQSDSRGNATVLDYQAAPDTSKITEPGGVVYSHLHDAQGNLTRMTDAANQALSYAYDANDRLSTLTNRLGDRVSIAYHDPSGFRSSTTDEHGNTTRYTLTAQVQGPFRFFNLTGIVYADGSSVDMAYDPAGNVLTRTDQAGKIWRYSYNSRGQYETIANPEGGVTAFTYNADGTLASAQTASGDKTAFVYDAAFRLTESRHPDGAIRRNEYDARNNPARQTNERGGVTSYSYDDNNQRRTVTEPSGAVWTSAYDTDDRLSTIGDPLSKVTRHAYDANGRLLSVTNGSGNRITNEYDSTNRLTSVDTAGKKITFGYDAEGRLTSAGDGPTRTWRFTRDKIGRVSRLTTPLGESYDRAYDGLGRTTATTDPLARTARYTYDSRGLLLGVQMPAGLSAGFEYNDLGRLTRIVDSSGASWKLGFDRMGRLITRTDPLAQVTSYSYDSRLRVSRMDFPAGNLQISYDAAGNPTRAAASDGIDLTLGYDANNRLTSAPGVALSYDAAGRITASNGVLIERDDAGRIAAMTYGAGKTVRYTYDQRGLLTRLTDWAGGATGFEWDDAARLAAISYANGTRQEFTYDRNGRLNGTQVRRGTTPLASIALRRDAAGQIASADRTPAPAAPPSGSLPLGYGLGHQVAGYTYDTQGRVTSDNIRTYLWDVRSRLLNYSGDDGSAAHTYDALGQRVSRTSGGLSESYAVNYAFRLPQIATVRSGGADRRYYLHLPDGQVLASIEASTNARRYYHFDESGSTLLLTDDSGAVTDTYAISPFGETVIHTGSTDNPFTFQGASGVFQEGATGLFYMRARYYDGVTARFLSRDPVGSLDPRAMHPYQYALNNPLSFGDPSGQNASNLLKNAAGGIDPTSALGDAILDWWNQFIGQPSSPNPPDYGDTSGLKCSFALSQQNACPPASQQQAIDDWWRQWVDRSTSQAAETMTRLRIPR